MNCATDRITSCADVLAPPSGRRFPLANEILIVVVSLFAFLVVWPVGEYAILDDWAFAKSLEHLHFESRLVVLDWNPMTLIGHLLWGLLFTKVFGFSFFATKVATFCSGVLVVICMQRFLMRHGVSSPVALLAGLALLLNPLYLAHVFMYMTDVTSLMWQWFSLGALGVSLSRAGVASVGWAITCSVCWGLAYLTRQSGIAIPVALAAYLLLFERPITGRLRWGAAALIPGAIVAVAGNVWHGLSQEPTEALRVMSDAAKEFVFHPPWLDLPFILWSYAIYAGLFVFPIALAMGGRGITAGWRGYRLAFVIGAAVLGLNLFLHYTLSGWFFPYIRNVVTPWGLFQPNEFAIQQETAPLWALEWGILVGLAGILSAIWLLAVLCRPDSPDDASSAGEARRRASRLLGLLLILQVAYALATAPFLFDRHLLVFAPTVIALAAIKSPATVRWPRRVGPSVALGVYAAYGIVCSHDIHALSRGVFVEGTRLIQRGIDPSRIDAGYAFDGWYMYERSAQIRTPPLIQIYPWWPSSYPQPTLKSFGVPWWIGGLSTQVRPEYVVTVDTRLRPEMFGGELRVRELECQEQIQTYWPWKRQRVRVFQAIPPESLESVESPTASSRSEI